MVTMTTMMKMNMKMAMINQVHAHESKTRSS